MAFPHDKLRLRRIELNLSRTEVANLSGLTARYVEALEQGRKPNPTHDTIAGLCRALGVKCDFFFEDVTGPDEDAPAEPEAERGGRAKGKRT